jgi:hypothetical protein
MDNDFNFQIGTLTKVNIVIIMITTLNQNGQ